MGAAKVPSWHGFVPAPRPVAPVRPGRHRRRRVREEAARAPPAPPALRDASCFRRIFIKLRPFCHALLIRETTILVRCPALRLTSSIAGGLRVIAHPNDEEQRYDPKKACLHCFPPLESTPMRRLPENCAVRQEQSCVAPYGQIAFSSSANRAPALAICCSFRVRFGT